MKIERLNWERKKKAMLYWWELYEPKEENKIICNRKQLNQPKPTIYNFFTLDILHYFFHNSGVGSLFSFQGHLDISSTIRRSFRTTNFKLSLSYMCRFSGPACGHLGTARPSDLTVLGYPMGLTFTTLT